MACECDARGRLGFKDTAYPQRPRLQAVLDVVLGVATNSIASHAMEMGITGVKVGQMIQAARVQAVAESLK
jgi:tRNA nucleotidyltransferase (CCA-adding enzyme)